MIKYTVRTKRICSVQKTLVKGEKGWDFYLKDLQKK